MGFYSWSILRRQATDNLGYAAVLARSRQIKCPFDCWIAHHRDLL